jgi:hypothetical protein
MQQQRCFVGCLAHSVQHRLRPRHECCQSCCTAEAVQLAFIPANHTSHVTHQSRAITQHGTFHADFQRAVPYSTDIHELPTPLSCSLRCHASCAYVLRHTFGNQQQAHDVQAAKPTLHHDGALFQQPLPDHTKLQLRHLAQQRLLSCCRISTS